MTFRRVPCLSPEAPAGAPAPAAPAVPPMTPERRADSYIDRLLQRYQTHEAALRALSVELFASQDQHTADERTIADLRAQVPAAGSVVLPKAEADSLAQLKALGTVDEIVAGMKERGELKAAAQKATADQAHRATAKAAGLDEDAFAAHALRESLETEMRDAQVVEAGKTVTKKVPFVRKAGDPKAPFVAASEYVTALPAHEQRALKPTAAPVAPTPTPWPSGQQPTPPSAPVDRVGAELQKINDRAKNAPNPLFPARAPAGATA
jgi:hypothetical protein